MVNGTQNRQATRRRPRRVRPGFGGRATRAVAAVIFGIALVQAAWPGVAAVPEDAVPGSPPSVGIALGGGGASGLAHVVMLEALDEMGIRPRMISGTSIGAIIGALYASGLKGAEIRSLIARFFVSSDEGVVQALVDQDAWRWMDFIQIDVGDGGLLSSEGFISFLYDELATDTFEGLEIPLKVVAADLWNRSEVVLGDGPLRPAIQASMALPGLFEPIQREGRLLVDGGTVNPVPYDLLTETCDIVIAIDVIGQRSIPESLTPSYFETIFNAVKVMQHAIMLNKRRFREPAIYIAPPITDIRALEFYRAQEVFEQARPAKAELKRLLREALDAYASGPSGRSAIPAAGIGSTVAPAGKPG